MDPAEVINAEKLLRRGGRPRHHVSYAVTGAAGQVALHRTGLADAEQLFGEFNVRLAERLRDGQAKLETGR